MIIAVSTVLALVCVGIITALIIHTKKSKSKTNELDKECEYRHTITCGGCCSTCHRRKGDN